MFKLYFVEKITISPIPEQFSRIRVQSFKILKQYETKSIMQVNSGGSMLGKLSTWFKALSLASKTGVILIGTLVPIGIVGATASPPTQTQTTQNAIKRDSVEKKTVTTIESVPYTTSTIDDDTLAQGTTKIKTAGVNGVRNKIWSVTYTNNIEINRTLESESIKTPAVNEVRVNGTKAPVTYTAAPTNCPNGTYVNSAGNEVCSPYSAPSTPSGATAHCRDGSYSFSQSRSGTCSHHGGVAQWL